MLTAPLAALLASPAAAITASAFAKVGVGVFEVTSAPPFEGEFQFFDPDEVLSVEYGPNLGDRFGVRFVRAEAQVEAPGRSKVVAESTITITNLTDETLNVDLDADRTADIDISIEEPGEAGRASASTLIDFDGVPADRLSADYELAFGTPLFDDVFEFLCDEELPCSDGILDTDGFIMSFDIAPSETVVVGLRAEAVAITPIPLSAALGPAVLALGGLAWAGRRRAKGPAMA